MNLRKNGDCVRYLVSKSRTDTEVRPPVCKNEPSGLGTGKGER